MHPRFAMPVAIVATAILLLAGCSDDDSTTATTESSTTTADGPTTLAQGADVHFVGGPPGLSGQVMTINAVEDKGTVTGEAQFDPFGTLDLQCADTGTDGLVIIGGQVTETSDREAAVGDWVAVVIRVGDPDGVEVWFAEQDYASCQDLLDAAAAGDHTFADVADGDTLETA